MTDEAKARTRRRLVAVSLAQFAARGLREMRTLGVPKAARVAHGTLFAHFPSPEGLNEAALEEFSLRRTVRDCARSSRGTLPG